MGAHGSKRFDKTSLEGRRNPDAGMRLGTFKKGIFQLFYLWCIWFKEKDDRTEYCLVNK